jgi:hypothetical protein
MARSVSTCCEIASPTASFGTSWWRALTDASLSRRGVARRAGGGSIAGRETVDELVEHDEQIAVEFGLAGERHFDVKAEKTRDEPLRRDQKATDPGAVRAQRHRRVDLPRETRTAERLAGDAARIEEADARRRHSIDVAPIEDASSDSTFESLAGEPGESDAGLFATDRDPAHVTRSRGCDRARR